MHERFELAYNIMYAVRNADGVIGLTAEDVARIRTAAAGIYMVEPYGVLAKTLDLAAEADEAARKNGAATRASMAHELHAP